MAFPLGAAMIWAVNMVVTKMAASVISPASIGFYRWLFAGIILTPFLLPACWRNRRAIAPHLGKLAVLGLLGMALYQGLAYVAAQTTSATNLGIITSLVPLMTLAMGMAVLRERPRLLVLAGGLLSLAGIAVLIGEGDPMRLLRLDVSLGDGLMLLAALSYALYGLLLRRWPMPFSAWQSMYVQVLFAIAFQLPAFLMGEPSPLNAGNLPMVLYATVFASLMAPYLWMQGIRHLGPARASLFINIMPFGAAATAALVLSEQLHSYHVVGGLMTLSGVMLAQRQPPAAQA